MKKTKTQKGITLIALIISVILLLIIAAVTIGAIQDSKIIDHAQDAASDYTRAQEKELIGLGYSEYQIAKYLNNQEALTVDGAQVSSGPGNGWSVIFEKTGNEYTVSPTGEIEETVIEKFDPVVNDEDPNDWDYAWVAPTNAAWDNTQYTKNQTLPEHTVVAMFYELTPEIPATDSTPKIPATYKLVIEGNGTMPPFFNDPTAPSELYGYQLLSVGALTGGSLDGAIITQVTEIRVCDGITSISAGAFAKSLVLNDLKISSTVDNIELMCLFDSSLQELTIPKGEIGLKAFCGVGLTKVTLGSGVTSIGAQAFSSCKNLTKVTISGGKISEQAFEECDALTSLTLNKGVTEIGYQAFNSCNELTSVAIPGTVSTISAQAFAMCPKLENVTLEYGINSIWELAFHGSAIKKLVLPGSIKNMGRAAFKSCSQLSELTLENGITVIGNEAFCETALTRVVIPASVTQIGDHAFRTISTLGEIDWLCTADNATVGQWAFEGLKNPCKIYVRKSAIKTAIEASGLSQGTTVEIK